MIPENLKIQTKEQGECKMHGYRLDDSKNPNKSKQINTPLFSVISKASRMSNFDEKVLRWASTLRER